MSLVITSTVYMEFIAFTGFAVERTSYIGIVNSAHKFALLCICLSRSRRTDEQSVWVYMASQLPDSYAVRCHK